MSDTTITKYLEGVKDAEDFLHAVGFRRLSFRRERTICIDKFIRRTTVVEFLFGPPEWHCEVALEIASRRVEAKDLIILPPIVDWLEENKNDLEKEDMGVRGEALWWAKLIERALPFVE